MFDWAQRRSCERHVEENWERRPGCRGARRRIRMDDSEHQRLRNRVESLKSLALLNVLTLFGLAAAWIVSEAFVDRAMLPGLGIWTGSQAYTSSSAVTVLPPPAPSIVQYAGRGARRRQHFSASPTATRTSSTRPAATSTVQPDRKRSSRSPRRAVEVGSGTSRCHPSLPHGSA